MAPNMSTIATIIIVIVISSRLGRPVGVMDDRPLTGSRHIMMKMKMKMMMMFGEDKYGKVDK